MNRPGMEPVAGRPGLAQAYRAGAAPSSRPGSDLHPVAARHGPGPASRPGADVSGAHRPSMEPYRQGSGRQSSNPGVDYAQAPAGSVRALVQHTDPDFQETLAHLQVTPPFGESEMQALAGSLYRCTADANQVILGQGEPADTCYWLADARARLEYAITGKPVEAIGSVRQGDFIGEGALIGAEAYPYTAAAGTASTLFAIGTAQFVELQRHAPAIAVRFLAAVAGQQVRRLRIDGKKIESFANQVLGIVAPVPAAEAGPAAPTALGRLFNRLAGGSKEEP